MKSKRKKTAEEFQLRLLLVGFINFDDSLSFLDFFGLFDFRRPLIIFFSLSKCFLHIATTEQNGGTAAARRNRPYPILVIIRRRNTYNGE